MWSVWRGWCDVLPFGDGVGGVNGCGPQSCPWGGVGEGRQGVCLVGVPGGVVVGDVGWQWAGGQDPDLGDGVVDVSGEFHFFHQLRGVMGVSRSWVSASASTVMVQVPSGSVTRAVRGRPKWRAQAARWCLAWVLPAVVLVTVRVRVMPAMVMVRRWSGVMWTLAGGQVCTGLSFRGCSDWDVQVAMHILCESKEGR